MGLTIDARCAIFARNPKHAPPGFDIGLVVPSLFDAESLVSVQWSTDPELGLPLAPFEVFVCDRVSLGTIERELPDATLDDASGFSLYTDRITEPEATLYIRGVVSAAAPETLLFALDGSGKRVRETAQVARPGEPFIIFGPTLGGIGADHFASIVELRIGAANAQLKWTQRLESAPAIDVPEYRHDVEGQGQLDALTAANWRLQGNTFARMSDDAPSHPRLFADVHLENIVQAAQEFRSARPFVEAEQNFAQVLADPAWSYVETVPDGATSVDAEVYPVPMLQLLKSLGPIEASTFGCAITAASERPPFLTRAELLGGFMNELLPYPVVRVVGHFSTGDVETFARLIFTDQPVTARGVSGEVLEPRARDYPATADADLTLEYGAWLETFFLERQSQDVGPTGIVPDEQRGLPKLFTPRAILKDGADAKDPWFSDGGLEIPDTDNPEVAHNICRRDEFGRWSMPLAANTLLPAFAVEPPCIVSVEPRYDANANVDLEIVVSRTWKLRTPHDIRLAVGLSKTLRDPALGALKPDGGVSSPALGQHADLRIVFDAAGKPAVQYGGVGPKPQVTPDDGDELPDQRSYTLDLRLGSARDIFGTADPQAVVAVTADAANVLGGSQRRSVPAPTQIRAILDPRPPVLASDPWQLVWSSRPNPQNRVRVLLTPPRATSGTLKGFRVWQATEAALIDFALDQASGASETAEIEALALLLKRTTNMPLRLQILRNRLAPMMSSAAARTAFFSKFDAIADHVWPAGQPVDLELPSRHEGLIILLLTGVSSTNVESIDILEADLRAVAVPYRLADPKPVVQVVTTLDPGGATPNACLLIVGSGRPLDPNALRIFWDTGEEFQNEESLLHRLPPSACFPLTLAEAESYLEDAADLIRRMETLSYAIFLLILPESWSSHYLTADILNPSPRNPAEEIPSRRASVVSCFVQPGSGPRLSIETRTQGPNAVEWNLPYSGMPMIFPPGFSPSAIYLELLDGSAKAGPLDLVTVMTQGMQLATGAGTLSLEETGNQKLKFTATGVPAGKRFRLTVVDPTNRSASVTFD